MSNADAFSPIGRIETRSRAIAPPPVPPLPGHHFKDGILVENDPPPINGKFAQTAFNGNGRGEQLPTPPEPARGEIIKKIGKVVFNPSDFSITVDFNSEPFQPIFR